MTLWEAEDEGAAAVDDDALAVAAMPRARTSGRARAGRARRSACIFRSRSATTATTTGKGREKREGRRRRTLGVTLIGGILGGDGDGRLVHCWANPAGSPIIGVGSPEY